MKRILLFLMVLPFVLCSNGQAQDVPDKITYCGIEISLSKGAREKLSNYINKIYESPPYFNAMVDRAGTFMPFVEEAFKAERVPDDLKYLIIQESSLKADAVSSSDAVGFWQFKEGAATDYGLQVSKKVDERMHIYKASKAAAQYLKNGNNDFDNWVYAVIAFYEGLTGAVGYTNPDFYAQKKMAVTENLHWYVMKAIAHKLAYEDALNMDRAPRVWLEPFSTEGKTQVTALYEGHGIEPSLFFEYNKWIHDEQKLPRNEVFTYYVPRINSPYAGHQTDPIDHPVSLAEAAVTVVVAEEIIDTGAGPESDLDIAETKSEAGDSLEAQSNVQFVEVSNPVDFGAGSFVAMDAFAQSTFSYVEFDLVSDLNYGQDFIMYDGQEKISDLSERYGIRLSNLFEWNSLIPGEFLENGRVLYIQKPSKVSYHVVERNETLETIALKHGSSVSKIQGKNRMDKNSRVIFVGQKLYLKKKKPKGEKVIVLVNDALTNSPNPVQEEKQPEVDEFIPGDNDLLPAPLREEDQGSPAKVPAMLNLESSGSSGSVKDAILEPGESTDFDPQTRWVVHKVGDGETLWSISVMYGTKVEIIKLTNKLSTDEIKNGMVLRILAKEDKLKALGSGQ